MWQSSNCDKTQELNLWRNSKNQNCDKTQKNKLWQNSRTQIVTKLKTQIVTKLVIWQISIYEEEKTLKGSFFKNILTPW